MTISLHSVGTSKLLLGFVPLREPTWIKTVGDLLAPIEIDEEEQLRKNDGARAGEKSNPARFRSKFSVHEKCADDELGHNGAHSDTVSAQ